MNSSRHLIPTILFINNNILTGSDHICNFALTYSRHADIKYKSIHDLYTDLELTASVLNN